MKRVLIAVMLGITVAFLLNVLRCREARPDAVDRLRESIDTSSLPARARQEMRSLLDQRRLRPSQFGGQSV